MVEIPATRGRCSAPSLVIIWTAWCLLFLAASIGELAKENRESGLAMAIAAAWGGTLAVSNLRKWRRGETRLRWDGHELTITHRAKLIFSGPIDSIEKVTEDGRGFFLHLDPRHQVRLRRNDTPPDLSVALGRQAGDIWC